MEVHEKIKVMRLFKGFTQQGMADELGYESVHGYAKLERGEIDPTLGKLKEITTVLGITLQDLLGLNQANIVNIAEHSLNNSNGSQNITLLSESQCANELEKARLLLQERDKEIEYLKKLIALLESGVQNKEQ
jgi:transcriptional regulator with XRE-family HTH domain